MLERGELVFLGAGARRECYAIPGTGLCLKCYRDESATSNATIAREIRRYRHDERRNACCREYRYWQKLKSALPPYVFAAFPDTMEQITLPRRGHAVVETRVRNADDTPCERFSIAYRAADDATRANLLKEFWLLVGAFAAYAVRFYDTQNIVVQRLGSGGIRLRVVDFEPDARTLIQIDSLSHAIVRGKVIRRAKRYLASHCGVKARYHGLKPRLRRKWDRLIATEGAELGLTDCRAFLENKLVNDIFYEGMFMGRPCVVKCSSRAPDSIRNEYEMSRRMFAAEPLSCAEPLALWRSRNGRLAFAVIECLPGPSLTEVCFSHRNEVAHVVDGIANDFERIALSLLKTDIVHGDMGISDNYLMGTDGHFRLIDFQFAVNRREGCRDPWLIAHPKYRFAVLSCKLDKYGACWNDVEYLRYYLLQRLSPTATSSAIARRLGALAVQSRYYVPFRPLEKFRLQAYAISLAMQRMLPSRKSGTLNFRYGRLRSLLA